MGKKTITSPTKQIIFILKVFLTNKTKKIVRKTLAIKQKSCAKNVFPPIKEETTASNGI